MPRQSDSSVFSLDSRRIYFPHKCDSFLFHLERNCSVRTLILVLRTAFGITAAVERGSPNGLDEYQNRRGKTRCRE